MSQRRRDGARPGDIDCAAHDLVSERRAETLAGTCTDAEPFALRVTDDSMAPEFPIGSIIIVDPSVAPADGRYVVAQTAGGISLGRLHATADGWQLATSAGNSAALPLDAASIRGAVIQRAGRRRRDHKRYR